jgi:hypothetical protein
MSCRRDAIPQSIQAPTRSAVPAPRTKVLARDVAVTVLAVDGKASKSVIDWLLSHDEIEKCGDRYTELRPLHNGARVGRRRTL